RPARPSPSSPCRWASWCCSWSPPPWPASWPRSCPAAGRPGSTCSGRSPRSSVWGMRREYAREALAEADVDADPVVQFGRWFEQAEQAGLLEPTAMTLATATPDGRPSARMVLLRGFDERGFCFYTNYESRKGIGLAA